MKIRVFAFVLAGLFGFISCKKDDIVPFYDAKSCFEISGNKIYIDSLVQFSNCSDSVNVKYLWEFGNGDISHDRIPKYRYRFPGEYSITLSTYVNDIKTDSSQISIKVFIGEKYYDFLKSAAGLNFVEKEDGSILVYGETCEGNSCKYLLCKFDKFLKLLWTKDLNEIHPFANMKMLSDGNILISGSINFSNSNGTFSFSKIDTSGNVIWNKVYSQIYGQCKYATEAVDGGIIAIGIENYLHNESKNLVKIVSVLKTDENGSFKWKKTFVDDWLMDASNIVPLNDGYLFASSTRGNSSILNGHDSLVVTKINLDGEIVWKKAKEWQIPDSHFSYNVWNSSITINENCIIVINDGNNLVMVFDHEGNFLNRNYSDHPGNKIITDEANNRFVITSGEEFWEPLSLNGFDEFGNKIWSETYGRRNKYCFPDVGYCASAKTLQDGNILFVGMSDKECSGYLECSMILGKIDANGEIQ